MKQALLVFLLSSAAVASDGQIRTWQLSLVDSSVQILYVGIENRIRVEQLPQGANVRSTRGRVSKGYSNSPDEFYVEVAQPGTDTLYIVKNGKRIFSKVFAVAYINDPKVRLGSIKGNTASVAQILADPVLHAYIDSCYYRHGFTVMGYDISFESHQLEFVRQTWTGNRIQGDVLDAVRLLKPGDKIVFNDIKAAGANCRIRNLGNLTYTIR